MTGQALRLPGCLQKRDDVAVVVHHTTGNVATACGEPVGNCRIAHIITYRKSQVPAVVEYALVTIPLISASSPMQQRDMKKLPSSQGHVQACVRGSSGDQQKTSGGAAVCRRVCGVHGRVLVACPLCCKPLTKI